MSLDSYDRLSTVYTYSSCNTIGTNRILYKRKRAQSAGQHSRASSRVYNFTVTLYLTSDIITVTWPDVFLLQYSTVLCCFSHFCYFCVSIICIRRCMRGHTPVLHRTMLHHYSPVLKLYLSSLHNTNRHSANTNSRVSVPFLSSISFKLYIRSPS